MGRLSREAALARQVWALAWPAIMHMLFVTLVFFACRVMLGRYSSTALASIQISGVLTWTIYSVFTAFSAGTLAVVARSRGAGDVRTAARAARASLGFAFVLGLLAIAPILIANGSLLRLLFPHAGPAVLSDARAYLHIVLPVLPLAFVEAIAAASLQAAGDTRTPLVVAAAGNLLNIALSAVLIFGRFGFPELGVRGAAIGTATTMSIEGLLLSAVLLSRTAAGRGQDAAGARRQSALAWAAAGAEYARNLVRVLRVSIPTFGEKIVYHAGFLGYVAIIGLLGEVAMASNQALVSIEAVCFLSADGFGVAAGALVAQKLGAGRPDEAGRTGLIASGMAVTLLSGFGLLFAVMPHLLISVFTTDPGVVAMGSRSLQVAAVAQPFMAFATVIAMSLRGAGDTRAVLYVTVVCGLFVRVAATWFFAIVLNLGLVGVWLGSTADWMGRSVLLGIRYLSGGWRRTVV